MKGHPSLKIEGKAVGKRPAFKTGSSRQGSSVSLAPSSVVRRSGSVGSLAAKPMPETASTSASPRGGPREINGRGREELHHKKESRGLCKCQELSAKARILQEDYTNNLQQQIYYLELENNYLRQGVSQYWNPEAKPRPQRDSQQRQSQVSLRSHGSSHHSQGLSHHIHRTYSDESLPDWSHRPIIHHHEAEEKPAPSPSKHVDFRFNHPPRRNDSPTEKEIDLMERLDASSQREYRLEERLTKRTLEYQHVLEDKTRLETRINDILKELEQATDRNLAEKRTLMEENIELQQRLDDLTPLIAQKESQTARLESEVEQLNSKLRLANSQNKSLQMRLDEIKREEVLFSERDSDRQVEIDRLNMKVVDLTDDLEKIRSKESMLIEEVSSLKRRLKEEELRFKKERSLNDKISEENNFLIKENSKWSSELTRMELVIDQQGQQLASRKAMQISADEMAELKVSERSLRSEISNLEERLRSEQDRNELYENQLRERELHEDQSRESRNRVQKELEALQALSRSLNNENRGMREEKLVLNERVEMLQKRLSEKEQETRQMAENLEELRSKYQEVHDQLERQSLLQNEKTHELDALVRKVRDLSNSIPRTPESRPAISSVTRTHTIHSSSKPSRIPNVVIEHQSISHRHDESSSTRRTGSRCSGKSKTQ